LQRERIGFLQSSYLAMCAAISNEAGACQDMVSMHRMRYIIAMGEYFTRTESRVLSKFLAMVDHYNPQSVPGKKLFRVV